MANKENRPQRRIIVGEYKKESPTKNSRTTVLSLLWMCFCIILFWFLLPSIQVIQPQFKKCKIYELNINNNKIFFLLSKTNSDTRRRKCKFCWVLIVCTVIVVKYKLTTCTSWAVVDGGDTQCSTREATQWECQASKQLYREKFQWYIFFFSLVHYRPQIKTFCNNVHSLTLISLG